MSCNFLIVATPWFAMCTSLANAKRSAAEDFRHTFEIALQKREGSQLSNVSRSLESWHNVQIGNVCVPPKLRDTGKWSCSEAGASQM